MAITPLAPVFMVLFRASSEYSTSIFEGVLYFLCIYRKLLFLNLRLAPNQKIVNANYAKKRAFHKFYTPKEQPRQPLTTWNTSIVLVENQPKQVNVNQTNIFEKRKTVEEAVSKFCIDGIAFIWLPIQRCYKN